MPKEGNSVSGNKVVGVIERRWDWILYGHGGLVREKITPSANKNPNKMNTSRIVTKSLLRGKPQAEISTDTAIGDAPLDVNLGALF